MIWRVPCKIYPDFFQGARLFFFLLIYKYDTLLFTGCTPEKKNWVDFAGCPSNQFSGYRLNGRLFDLSDLSDRRRRYVKTARMICSDIVFLSSCPFPHIFLKSFLFCVLEWVISHLADYHGEKLIFKIHLEQKQHYVLFLKKQHFSQILKKPLPILN